jgi:hypothetical protein
LDEQRPIGAKVSLFDWLLVGHLIGDFLIQTDDMAAHKTHSRSWMLRHIGFYAAVMAVALVLYALTHALSPWMIAVALLFICLTHLVLDQRDFTGWWMRVAGISSDRAWLTVVVDQVFHLLTLAVTAQVLVLASG